MLVWLHAVVCTLAVWRSDLILTCKHAPGCTATLTPSTSQWPTLSNILYNLLPLISSEEKWLITNHWKVKRKTKSPGCLSRISWQSNTFFLDWLQYISEISTRWWLWGETPANCNLKKKKAASSGKHQCLQEICAILHNSCRDISVWSKEVDQQTTTATRKAKLLAWLTTQYHYIWVDCRTLIRLKLTEVSFFTFYGTSLLLITMFDRLICVIWHWCKARL